MDFDGVIYGQTFDNLENAIHAASARQTKIAQNIANIESNNYDKANNFANTLEKAQARQEAKQALIDNELSKLAENNLKITSYSQLLSSKLKTLRKVVTLGKG
jgi:flagellar basal body rod protein FlgB